MRLVLDTNVVASGLLWGGAPRVLLTAGRERRVALFTSPPLMRELADILLRKKFERKIAASRLSVDELVAGYGGLAAVVRPAVIAPTIIDDPDDDQVLACGVAARADLIVSGDHHLLTLRYPGGISVALALSLPLGPGRDIVLTLTYCIVVFSILGQGLTIGWVVRKAVTKRR
jgi:hypothetical protein